MTARAATSLTLTDGSRLALTRDGSRLRIQGTIITPGAITLTVDGQEIALAGPMINQTTIVSDSAPITVVVTDHSPTGTQSGSSTVLKLSAAGPIATSAVRTSTAAISRSGSAVVTISTRSVAVTRNR